VLVVDDQASVGRFMVDQLETFGLEAMHCASPAEALGMLDGPEPPADVVIVDYTMPEMNGLEFIEGLRQRQPRLPALLYSGYLEQVPEDTLARLDLPPPLEKPINTLELFRALQRLLPN
jgi:CheY-like chemotaxis protein